MSKISRDKKKLNKTKEQIKDELIDRFIEKINFSFVTFDHEFGDGNNIPKIVKINNNNEYECKIKINKQDIVFNIKIT